MDIDKDLRALLGWLLVFAALVAVLVLVHLSLRGGADDDAYIHMRLADQLVQHGQPYFNIDEPVKGSSSTGWVLFIALLFSLFGSSPSWVAIANAVLSASAAVLFARVVDRLAGIDRPRSRLLAGITVLTLLALLIRPSVGLMETPLAALLVAGGVLQLVRARGIAFCLLAAAVFVRPELLVLYLVLAVYRVVLAPRDLARILAWSAVGALPFICFDLFFYHTLIPHAVVAKSRVYDLSFWDSLVLLMQWLCFPVPGGSLTPYLKTIHGLLLLLATAGLCWSALSPSGRLRELIPANLLLMSGIVLIGLYLAARAYVHAWYLPLFMLPLAVCAIVHFARNRSLVLRVLLLTAAIPLWADLGLAVAGAAPTDRIGYRSLDENAHVRQLKAVGHRLERLLPGGSLLTSEIGALGWACTGRVVDGAGLVSPDALQYHPMKVPGQRSHGSVGAIPPQLVADENPDIIVSRRIFLEAFRRSTVAIRYRRVPDDHYLRAKTAVEIWLHPDVTSF
jgi:hypothetical protein